MKQIIIILAAMTLTGCANITPGNVVGRPGIVWRAAVPGDQEKFMRMNNPMAWLATAALGGGGYAIYDNNQGGSHGHQPPANIGGNKTTGACNFEGANIHLEEGSEFKPDCHTAEAFGK